MTEPSPGFRFEQFAALDLYTVLLNRDLHEPCDGSGVIALEVNGETEFEPCVCSDWVSQAMTRYLPLFLETFQEVMVHRVREVEWQDRVGDIVVQERLMEIAGIIVNYFLPDNYVITGAYINQFDEVELTVMRPGDEIAYRIFKADTFGDAFRLAINKLSDEELEIEVMACNTRNPDEDELARAEVVFANPVFYDVLYTVNGCQGVLSFTVEKERIDQADFDQYAYFLKEVRKYYDNLEGFIEVRSTQRVDPVTTLFDHPLVREAKEKDLLLYFVTFSYRGKPGAMLKSYSRSIFQQPGFNFDALLKTELVEFIIENPAPNSWELHGSASAGLNGE